MDKLSSTGFSILWVYLQDKWSIEKAETSFLCNFYKGEEFQSIY